MKKLTTVDEVIEAFGGATAVANWFGLTQPAVSNWRMKNEIPPGWHLRLVRHAERIGIEIDDAVFGLTDDDPKAPRPVGTGQRPGIAA
jgi:predicted transcriptional regulator